MNLRAEIIYKMNCEDVPLFLGEIINIVNHHWFVVKKMLETMADEGVIARRLIPQNPMNIDILYSLNIKTGK